MDGGKGRTLAEVGQQQQSRTRTPGSMELAQCSPQALCMGCRDGDTGVPGRRHAV